MQKLNIILKDVLAGITPCRKEREETLRLANAFLKQLNASLKKNRLSAKAVLGGSYAKDTWLKGDYDVDVFVRFALKHRQENLSNLLAKALKGWNAERIHGSRDYFWVRQKQFRFEIVPVLAIRRAEEAENVTDFSPMHVKWVNTNAGKYKGDIRLFKKFCKAQGIYGAESYIRGFSGHVADILVTHYGGFARLLKAAAKWKPKTIIDYYHKYDRKALFVLNRSKIQGPLIIIDPVQKDRNAAAALSQDKYDELVKAAGMFLKKPDKKQFTETEVDLGKLAKQGHLLQAIAKGQKGREDVTGTKMLHVFEYIKRYLQDFEITASGWKWDRNTKAEYWYVVKKHKLPDTMIWPGPPLELEKAAAGFRKKHKKAFVKDHRLFAQVKRPYTTPEKALAAAANDAYVKHRSITIIQLPCEKVSE